MGWKLKAFLRGMGSVMNIWPAPLKTTRLLLYECGECGWSGDRPASLICPNCKSGLTVYPWVG